MTASDRIPDLERPPSVARPVVLGFVGALLVLLAGFGIWYASLAFPYFRGVPTISRNYVEEYNQDALAIEEDDRAWPLYREAALAIPPEVIEAGIELTNARPGDEAWPDALAALERLQETLVRARRGAAKPELGSLWNTPEDHEILAHMHPDQALPQRGRDNPPLFTVRPPQFTALQTLGRWLVIDAIAAAESGDSVRSLESLLAAIAIADHVSADGLLISDLVGFALFNWAQHAFQRTLAHQPDLWSDDQLQALAAALRAFQDGSITCHFIRERDSFHDFVQRIYTDDGAGDGRVCAAGLQKIGADAPIAWDLLGGDPQAITAPFNARKLASRKDLLAKHAEYIQVAKDEAAIPLWQRTGKATDSMIESLRMDPALSDRYRIFCVLAPAVSRASANAEMAIQGRDVTLTLIALELYRRRHASYPPSLHELVPEFLPEVPLDRFTGDPLGYIPRSGARSFVLYSRGADRDDDGGRMYIDPLTEEPNNRAASFWTAFPASAPDADWVLYPPQD